jgi:phage major head subunit gpT-like protein
MPAAFTGLFRSLVGNGPRACGPGAAQLTDGRIAVCTALGLKPDAFAANPADRPSMRINATSLRDIFAGFKTAFNAGFKGAQGHHRDVAMIVPSGTREEHYAWLGQFPNLREWLGDRVVKSLTAHGYGVPNRKFELTVAVSRPDVEVDRFGVFAPLMTEMGRVSAEHPDELVFSLPKAGFTSTCYDGQYFFDTDHPVGGNGSDYPAGTVANSGGGSGTA